MGSLIGALVSTSYEIFTLVGAALMQGAGVLGSLGG